MMIPLFVAALALPSPYHSLKPLPANLLRLDEIGSRVAEGVVDHALSGASRDDNLHAIRHEADNRIDASDLAHAPSSSLMTFKHHAQNTKDGSLVSHRRSAWTHLSAASSVTSCAGTSNISAHPSRDSRWSPKPSIPSWTVRPSGADTAGFGDVADGLATRRLARSRLVTTFSIVPQYTPAQSGMMGYDVPSPVSMLGTVQEDESDNTSSRLDLGLGIISLSAAMIATGLTSSCLAAKTCHETVTITKWAFDRGPIWGVVGRAGVNGLIHYAVGRWIPKGKWRTATLATLAVINVTNAVLDTRTLLEIDRQAK